MPKIESNRKLPNEVFVHWNVENRRPEDHFLSLDEDVNAAAELGTSRKVGRYVLQEVIVVTGAVKIGK